MEEKKQRTLSPEEETFLLSRNLTEPQNAKVREVWQNRDRNNQDFPLIKLLLPIILIGALISFIFFNYPNLEKWVIIFIWVNSFFLIALSGLHLVSSILIDSLYLSGKKGLQAENPEKYLDQERMYYDTCLQQSVFRIWGREWWLKQPYSIITNVVIICLLLTQGFMITATISIFSQIFLLAELILAKGRLDKALKEITKDSQAISDSANCQS